MHWKARYGRASYANGIKAKRSSSSLHYINRLSHTAMRNAAPTNSETAAQSVSSLLHLQRLDSRARSREPSGHCKTETMDGQGKEGSNNGGGSDQCDVVARAFVEYYYHTFDTNRAALAALYGHASMLSFEGHMVAGTEEIGRKLAQLPFEQCRHSICTVDCQPTPSFPGGILVFVSGNLQLAGEEHQLRFSQMFQLVPNEQRSFFVQNDIFRLNYG